jgi:hypothetical protein
MTLIKLEEMIHIHDDLKNLDRKIMSYFLMSIDSLFFPPLSKTPNKNSYKYKIQVTIQNIIFTNIHSNNFDIF